ncbi:alpha/beta fold hydrolase [soil metagenome]
MVDLLWTGPALPQPDALEVASPTLVLAHGAGAGMESKWMNDFCALLGDRGLRTVRFEFGYMAARRTGGRRPPPRADTLIDEYVAAVGAVRMQLNVGGYSGSKVVIGGKSMGGRVATMSVDSFGPLDRVDGVVCLGYPFHPPDKPHLPRTAHLLTSTLPMLICQGTRDPFGGPDEVIGYELPASINVTWFDDGDHDLRPRQAVSGHSYAEHLNTAADAVVDFVNRA